MISISLLKLKKFEKTQLPNKSGFKTVKNGFKSVKMEFDNILGFCRYQGLQVCCCLYIKVYKYVVVYDNISECV